MGYFPNGCAADAYQELYCERCAHNDPESGCAIWFAHLLHSYEECNKKDSILHLLIPRDKDGYNTQCLMFLEGQPANANKADEDARAERWNHAVRAAKGKA